MSALSKVKRILRRWYGQKFTVYVGTTSFEVDLEKLRLWTGGPLKLKVKEPKEREP